MAHFPPYPPSEAKTPHQDSAPADEDLDDAMAWDPTTETKQDLKTGSGRVYYAQ